jgi:hypothetical protein
LQGVIVLSPVNKQARARICSKQQQPDESKRAGKPGFEFFVKKLGLTIKIRSSEPFSRSKSEILNNDYNFTSGQIE